MEFKINYIIIVYTWNKSCIHIRNEYKVAHVKPEVNFTGKHRGNRKSKLHTDVSKHRISRSFVWVPWTSTQPSFTVLVNGILHKRASDCCLIPNTKCIFQLYNVENKLRYEHANHYTIDAVHLHSIYKLSLVFHSRLTYPFSRDGPQRKN